MATLSVPSISGEGNLTRYLQEIRKFPMLEPNEEYMLAGFPVTGRMAVGLGMMAFITLLAANQLNAFIYFRF